MNSFVPVEADDLAASLGLPSDSHGLPARSAVAEAVRKYIAVRRAADIEEVGGWFEALASAAGYPEGATTDRFRSVCRQLAAVGDLSLVGNSDRQHLVAVEPVTISLGLEHDVLLGDMDLGDALNDTETIIRRTPAQDQAHDLFEQIPPPPWSLITEQLGLVEELEPARILKSLREATPQSLLLIDKEAGIEPAAEFSNPPISLGIVSKDAERVPVVSFTHMSGKEVILQLGDSDALAWLYLSETGIAGVSDWPSTLKMPDSLLSILTILGTPVDDTLGKWRLEGAASAILSDWLGIPLIEQAPEVGDEAQAEVIKAPINKRLLVSAGPGSGKTWTACTRIAKLIEEGAVPSRLLVVSFTRAAVAEIRNRIASFLSKPADAYDINIQTLDSLAWSLNVGAGFDGGPTGSDFETGIRTALALLETGEDWLLDELERYQHVMIDEAQDLTGNRRSMVLALMKRLEIDCGVTVFHDPAQSIYHFVEGERSGIDESIATLEPAFSHIDLKENYRCNSTKLLDFFAEGRDLLASHKLTATEIYQGIRSGIEGAAEPLSKGDARGDERDTFHLFRWRGQLTAAINQALRADRPVRTRPIQSRTLIQPWIAATLNSLSGGSLAEQEFHQLYSDLHPFPGRPAGEAWQILRRVCSDDRGGIDLRKLAEVMKSSAPVADIAISDVGPRTAPLYSTIHAAKGREADTVVLGLPGMTREEEEEKIVEEARVLFVGATRASRKLRIGASPKGMKTLAGSSKRKWRTWTGSSSRAAYVEIGLPGDVLAVADEMKNGGIDDANFILWRESEKTNRGLLSLEGNGYQIRMASDPEGPVLGCLSATFMSDLMDIGQSLTGGAVRPSASIQDAFIVGACSIVTGDDPKAPRFALAPILAGTPLVFFNQR